MANRIIICLSYVFHFTLGVSWRRRCCCEAPDLDSDFQLFDPDGSFAWLLLCFAGLFTSGWTLGGC